MTTIENRSEGEMIMELLLKRKEIGRNKYDLFAKLELTPEEEARMRKADTRNTYVWEPDFVWV